MLVINKVTAELERVKAAIPVAAIEGNLKRKAVAVVPMDERRVLAAINRGITVIAKDRNMSPAKELITLADTIRASVSPEEQAQPQGAEASKQQSRLGRLFGG
jgi:MinD-like ATPase involved in chromosome partitioning or flagellar assembly